MTGRKRNPSEQDQIEQSLIRKVLTTLDAYQSAAPEHAPKRRRDFIDAAAKLADATGGNSVRGQKNRKAARKQPMPRDTGRSG